MKKINLKNYPIIKKYKVLPTGSLFIHFTKSIETSNELKELEDFIKELNKEDKKGEEKMNYEEDNKEDYI